MRTSIHGLMATATLTGAALLFASAPAGAAVPAISAPVNTLAGDTAVGTYYPITKNQRILDTRSGLGAPKTAVGPGGVITVQVGGRAGVPAGSAASAVVLNLTAVSPTLGTYLTAYSSSGTRPGVSSLNIAAKGVRANMVTVPVGSDGKIRIYNHAGSVNIVADVVGFYAGTDIQGTNGIGSMYFNSGPDRLFDSRAAGNGILAPGDAYDLNVDFGAEANASVRAFAVNVTAISPTGPGFVSAWDGVADKPVSSTINFVKGQTLANMAVVPTRLVDGVPTFAVGNFSPSASVHVAVDIVGVYVVGQNSGFRFTPVTPTRIVDTRPGSPIGAGATRVFTDTKVAGDPTYHLVGNVTGVVPTNTTYLTVFEDATTRPGVSNLNLAPKEIAANAAYIPLGPGNKFDVYNHSGLTDVLVDVTGKFDEYMVPAAGIAATRTVAPNELDPSDSGSAQR